MEPTPDRRYQSFEHSNPTLDKVNHNLVNYAFLLDNQLGSLRSSIRHRKEHVHSYADDIILAGNILINESSARNIDNERDTEQPLLHPDVRMRLLHDSAVLVTKWQFTDIAQECIGNMNDLEMRISEQENREPEFTTMADIKHDLAELIKDARPGKTDYIRSLGALVRSALKR